MNKLNILLKHELKMLAINPASYIASVLFLLFMGLMYWAILQEYSQGSHDSLPSITFFEIFWLPVLFVVPLLTMKSISEEWRMGTAQATLTTSIHTAQWVLAKFLAAYLFYLLLWSLTLFFPLIASLSIADIQSAQKLWDIPSLMGGYLFIALSGMLYIGIGIFASSLTRSQFIAGMLTFILLFIIIIGGRMLSIQNFSTLHIPQSIHVAIDYLQTFEHLKDFLNGRLDTRPIVLYTTHSILCIWLTTCIVERKV